MPYGDITGQHGYSKRCATLPVTLLDPRLSLDMYYACNNDRTPKVLECKYYFAASC